MKIDDPRVKTNISELAAALAGAGDNGLIEDFLRCLLTPAETADIAARWALVKDLDAGLPQREIARNLGISLCKITRGSRELKKPNSAWRLLLDTTRAEKRPPSA
ncbi:MAG: trp operon repressor [Treponema sp.]|jgi:TrpR family trp operon transcriptional repressor|nr:trp operon repressor [Treponema sp.]